MSLLIITLLFAVTPLLPLEVFLPHSQVMDVDFGDATNSGGGGGGGDDITSDLLQKFSCMNTNDRDVLINQFKVLLGEKCTMSNAEFWLDMNNW